MTHAEESEGLPSASDGEKFFNCAGSRALEAEAPPEVPSAEALQGTEIAAAMESDDFTALDEGGRTIAENLKRQREEALDAWQKEFDEPTDTLEIVKEVRFWIRGPQGNKVCSAKPDFAAIGRVHGLVIDDKSGFLPVTPAFKNIQARIQAVSLQHEYPRIRHVRAIISAYRFRGRIDPVDYNGLAEAHQELFFRIWNTKQPHAPRVPGPWCRYCRAKTLCPQFASWAMLPMVHTGSEPLKKKDAEAVAHKLTLAQLAYIALRLPMLMNFAEAVKDRLKACSDEELASVGLRRQATGSVTTVPDVRKLWGAIHASGLMTETEFMACLKPVIGTIEAKLVEKLLKERDYIGQEKVAVTHAKAILAPVTEQKPKAPTIKALKADKDE